MIVMEKEPSRAILKYISYYDGLLAQLFSAS